MTNRAVNPFIIMYSNVSVQGNHAGGKFLGLIKNTIDGGLVYFMGIGQQYCHFIGGLGSLCGEEQVKASDTCKDHDDCAQ